jgi:hypothetical protein
VAEVHAYIELTAEDGLSSALAGHQARRGRRARMTAHLARKWHEAGSKPREDHPGQQIIYGLTCDHGGVRLAGLEPATGCLEGSCSIQLSYRRPEHIVHGVGHMPETMRTRVCR